jgi:hypothetical protein
VFDPPRVPAVGHVHPRHPGVIVPRHRARPRRERGRLRVVPYKRMSGWSAKASGVELKGAEGGD